MAGPIRIDAGRLASCMRDVRLEGWTRILPAVHAGTPTGSGPGDSRFASHRSAYTLLYAADDFTTAFAETVVRDRFEDGRAERHIDWVEIEARVVVRLAMVDARTTLRAADLRGEAPLRLGIPSDVVRARAHRLGRAFGEALFTGFSDVDAILFGSRFTGLDVIAVRGTIAVAALHATPARPLMDHDDLPVALERLGIMISASPAGADGLD